MNRKYIAAVVPLPDHILQVDFVSGSRRRILSVLLSLTICLSLLPATALAAQTGSSDSSRTVFDALGFDTKAPEGYEQDESLAGTPYGKTFTTMAEVDELFTFEPKKATDSAKSDSLYSTLYGHNKTASGAVLPGNDGANARSLGLGSDAGPISLQVEGNFSRDNQGQKKNIAFINISYVSTATDDEDRPAVDSSKGALVNFDLGVIAPNATANTANKGVDVFYRANEFSPKYDTSTAATMQPWHSHDAAPIYLGNKDDATAKKYTDKVSAGENVREFKAAYTAQNYIELAAADYDKDGIDDLAVSWGYCGPESNQPSHAVIIMGADNNQMLTRSYSFSLKANGTDIYRAGFTSGDVDNDGYNELVLGGSLANSTNDSRYLAIYEWTDKGFEIVTQQNFDLFEEENGVRTWQNIKDEKSITACPLRPPTSPSASSTALARPPASTSIVLSSSMAATALIFLIC